MEQVLLPREPPGQTFSAWLRALLLAHGFELERTIKTLSARWDHRMLPVADGRAVSVLVRKWVREAITGVVGVPFDPPLSFPMDLVSRWPPTDGVDALVQAVVPRPRRRMADAAPAANRPAPGLSHTWSGSGGHWTFSQVHAD